MSKEVISYFGKTGCIWEDGIQRGGGPPIPNGVEIRVVIDMHRAMVKWYMDRK